MFCVLSCFVFFFKQKSAYEMRISDSSSDVCSSDLVTHARCSALLHRDGDIDAVAIELGDAGLDGGGVLAAVVVLADQFLGYALQIEPVEGFALDRKRVG